MHAEKIGNGAVENAERMLRSVGVSPFYSDIPAPPIPNSPWRYIQGLEYRALPDGLIYPTSSELQEVLCSIAAEPKTRETLAPIFFDRQKTSCLLKLGISPTPTEMTQFLAPFNDATNASLTIFVGTRGPIQNHGLGINELNGWNEPSNGYTAQRVFGYSSIKPSNVSGLYDVSMQFAPTMIQDESGRRRGPVGRGYGQAVWPHRLAHLYYFALTRGAKAVQAIVHHANQASQSNLLRHGFKHVEEGVPLYDLDAEHTHNVFQRIGIDLGTPPSQRAHDQAPRDRYVATKTSLQASLRGGIGDGLAQVLGLEDLTPLTPITDDAMDLIVAMHHVDFATRVNHIFNAQDINLS